MSISRNIIFSLGLSAYLGLVGGAAMAVDAPLPGDLLRDPAPVGLPSASATGEAGALPPKVRQGRDRPVAINTQLLRGERIGLNLFGDAALVGERDRVVEEAPGRSVWIGHVQGEPASEVVLAFRDQALSGTVRRENGDLYEIVYQGNGLHRVRQLDHAKTPPHPHPVAAGALPATPPAPGQPAIAADTASTAIVDLMVVYTPRARANAGGAAGIKARIDNAVAAANQAYINSLIDMRLRLVHTAEVPYTETGNMSRTLYDLQKSNDGKMDVVHQWRNQYGADQVLLISADANYCGIGYQMSKLSASFSYYAFSVAHDDSRYACLSNQTLAHELGHNQGNAHDRANSTTPGIYPYSYGHRLCQSGGFRTVMAYPCSGAGTISYFANPSVAWNGMALGIDPAKSAANSAADAWSMMSARTTVANWRASVAATGTATVGAAPIAPANLAASPSGADQIALDWLDVSDDEAGFRVEYSLDGAEWREIANLGPNATHFAHTGLSPATRYAYRVTAYNGMGGSAPTNVSSAATPAQTQPGAADSVAPVARIDSPGDKTQVGDLAGIVATGRDEGGIQSLKLYIDGRLKAASNGAVLTFRWNTQGVAPGVHGLEVVAMDKAGNTGRAAIQVRK